ncbi:MAG: hypothetical protein JW943_00065 [Deltaproteobacteria bacterium]|nr:hypothetical protein [Deltaproteobacteria bacterium]
MVEATRGLHSDLLDFQDHQSILAEVTAIVSLMDHNFDCRHIKEAFNDVERLFRGEYPGYQACNTHYHNIRHTMMVFLAMARLIHGVRIAGWNFSEKEMNVGIISALMHDAGYIQRQDDHEGTGAKFTAMHIEQSKRFIEAYYKGNDYFQGTMKSFADILDCTGLNTDIDRVNFSSANDEMMGKILGTADLLAQMADRYYLEKLAFLFHEFDEAHVPGFESEIDLQRKTVNFYSMTKNRMETGMGNVNRFMANHFKARHGLDRNIYDDAIDKNIGYLKHILEIGHDDLTAFLRRNPIKAL